MLSGMFRAVTVAASLALVPAAVLAQSTPAPAAAQDTAWTIDSGHTTAGFSVRHMMVSNVRGVFGKVAGNVTYDGKDVSSIVADVTIETASIDTNSPKRDDHLRSADFFDAATHPTITFKSKKVQKGAAGKFQLIGDLTIRGVTKPVTLDVEGPSPPITSRGGTKIGASATTKINRKDFNINWNSTLDGGGVVVSDEVVITLDIELNKKTPAPTAAQ